MSSSKSGEEFLSPVETRRLLGVSRTRIQQFERRGDLHPVVDERGVHRFARSEVERLRRARASRDEERTRRPKVPGDVAARVFELFDEGWTLPQIVRETKLAPESVRELHVEYRTPFEHGPRTKAKAKGTRSTVPSDDASASSLVATVLSQLNGHMRKEGT